MIIGGVSMFVATRLGWDISKAVYQNPKNYAPLGAVRGVTFKPDGLSMYVSVITTGDINQYTLSTAWDVTTASSASKQLNTSTQTESAWDLDISSDGTRVYVADGTGTIRQYTLSTPWDMSTGSYTGSLSIATQTAICYCARISPDGTKLYALSYAGVIYQYTLGTAYLLSTGTYASKSLTVSGEGSQFYAFNLDVTGNIFYTASDANNAMYQYRLGTAYDVSTGSYSGKSAPTFTPVATPTGLCFKPNGYNLYIASANDNKIYQFTL